MHIAVLFARLGPYHVARLRALSAFHDVLSVELSGENINYAWDPVDNQGLRHVQLFDQNHRTVRPAILRASVGQTLDAHTPDVVAVPGWWDPGALAAIEWCLDSGKRVVMMSDSSATDAPRVWWREWPKRRVVELSDAAFVAGSRHVDYMAELGMPRARIFTGYDVVDNTHFEAGARRARANADQTRTACDLPERYFLACCRFVEKKNLPRLITGYAQYRSKHTGDSPLRTLVVVGDGPQRDILKDQVEALGIRDSVQFPGFLQYDELPKYYGLADAFVHPSTHEQWGLVVNEAMAAGLPVLVSERCGCAADLVQPGKNGYTFDPYDSGQIAERLGEISRSHDRLEEMGAASRAIVRSWTTETFAENLGKASQAAMCQPGRRVSWGHRLLLRILTRKSLSIQ